MGRASRRKWEARAIRYFLRTGPENMARVFRYRQLFRGCRKFKRAIDQMVILGGQ